MFTTRIGPPNISEEYLEMLRNYLNANLEEHQDFIPLLEERSSGVHTIEVLQESNFELFFKLAVPKVLASLLVETDWYVDPTIGIQIFEFERTPEGVTPYKMLHIVMDVIKQNPPRRNRPPGLNISANVREAYTTVVRRIIADSEITVTLDSINQEKLQLSLDKIIARRRKYCPDV
jgi:hypothetical protein